MFQRKKKIKGTVATVLLLLLLPATMQAQQKQGITLEQALALVKQHNPRIKLAQLQAQARKQEIPSAFNLPKTSIDADYGQVSSISHDTRFGISQSFSLPAVYQSQRKVLEAAYAATNINIKLTEQELTAALRHSFYQYVHLEARQQLLQYADSIYGLFESRSELRFEKGAANILEQTTARAHRQEISNQLQLLQDDMNLVSKQFNFLLQDSTLYIPQAANKISWSAGSLDTPAAVAQLPLAALAAQKAEIARYQWKAEQAQKLPELSIGYNNQSLIGVQQVAGVEQYFGAGKRFSYVTAGVSIPIFSRSITAKAAAAKTDWQRSRAEADYTVSQLQTAIGQAYDQVQKYTTGLQYYENKGLQYAEQIIRTADEEFKAGEIDYLQWVILVDQAISIRTAHLNMLEQYNTAVIELLKLNNQ